MTCERGNPIVPILDQYAACPCCQGVLYEAVGVDSFRGIPVETGLRNAFVYAAQITGVARQFAGIVGGQGGGVQGSAFGVTHFGGR